MSAQADRIALGADALAPASATGTLVAVMGVFAGLTGLEHGVGEMLQGSVAPAGLVFAAWPDAPFFEIQAGEPALSVIPNLLVSGVLASLLSLAFIPCAIWIARRRHGAWALLGLSAAMLLVGAGFGPPFLGVILGIAAAQIHAPLKGWPARLPAGLRRRLAGAWPWLFGVCLVAWLLLSPGSAVLGYFFGVDSLALVPVLFFTALGALLLSIAAGLLRDAQARTSPAATTLR